VADQHPERLLRAMLDEHVPSGQAVTPALAWVVFLAFARVDLGAPDVPDADGLLYEYGVFELGERPIFSLDLGRQLAVADKDEYVQVHLGLTFPPTADLEALGSYDSWYWPADGPLDQWASSVRSRPEWRVVGDLAAEEVVVFSSET
jgi:hypothetical protein